MSDIVLMTKNMHDDFVQEYSKSCGYNDILKEIKNNGRIVVYKNECKYVNTIEKLFGRKCLITHNTIVFKLQIGNKSKIKPHVEMLGLFDATDFVSRKSNNDIQRKTEFIIHFIESGGVVKIDSDYYHYDNKESLRKNMNIIINQTQIKK